MKKMTGSTGDVDMEKAGTCKMDKIKNAVVLERVGEGRIMLELIKKRKRNCWATGLEGTTC